MALSPVTDKQKQLFQLMNQGKAFMNPLNAGSAALSGAISESAGHISRLTNNLNNPLYADKLQAAGITPTLLTSMTAGAAAGAAAVVTLKTYGDQSVSEFSQRARIADNYRSISQRFTGVDPGCSSLSGVMGVVKDLGQSAMDICHSVMDTANSAIAALNSAIESGLSAIDNIIQQALGAINSAISQATAFVNKVTTMIADEVEELARQAQAAVNGWLAGVLPDWFGDECKGELMDTVGTPALKSAVAT